ncbi:MAG TPA: hypothetical protein VNG12_09660 [Acidimicrobiales bacterium]|nr:hypothetical protein [Acidimicrobiales bacterium]
MGDHIVVLRSDDPLDFIADACAALADLVNEMHLSRSSDLVMIKTYAELLVAFANLRRPYLAADSSASAQLAIIDHLVERLRQSQAGEFNVPMLDVADRLHAELARLPVFA